MIGAISSTNAQQRSGCKIRYHPQKRSNTKRKAEEYATVKATQLTAQEIKEKQENQFFRHRKMRTLQLLKRRSPADLVKLGEAVAEALPTYLSTTEDGQILIRIINGSTSEK